MLEQTHFENLLAQMSSMAWVLDDQGVIHYANRAACTQVHKTDTEIIGQKLSTFYPERMSRYQHYDQKVLNTGTPLVKFIEHFIHNNTTLWFQVDRIPLKNTDNTTTYIVHIASDITPYIHNTGNTRQIADMFASCFHHSATGVALLSPSGKWLKVNQSLCDILGYQESELLNTNFEANISSQHLKPVKNLIEQMVNKEVQTHRLKKRHRRPNGQDVDLSIDVTLIWDENIPLYFILYIQDITEYTLTKKRVEKHKQRLELALDATCDGIWDRPDINRDEEYWSPHLKELLGYQDEEIEGRHSYFMTYVHPEDLPTIQRKIDTILHDGKPYTAEYRIRTKSGEYRWFQSKVKSTFNAHTQTQRLSGSLSDIHDRKLIEKQIHSMYEALAYAVDGISRIDENLNFHYINETLAKITGYGSDELIGKAAETIIHPNDLEQFRELFVKLENCKKVSIELNGIKKNGKMIYMQLVVVHDPLEREYYCFVRDISKRKKVSNKLEKAVVELTNSNIELERFAYICSHDLQEPLRIISNYSQLILAETASMDQQTKLYFKFIQDNALRMSELIKDVLNYSRVNHESSYDEQIDLNRILQETLHHLHLNITGHKASISTTNTLPTVYGNRVQIGQVFHNLLTNALKFCNESQPLIEISSTELHGEWQVNIKDNGIGIDPEYHHKIFDIFKRLHKQSEYYGTGIGLALCKKVMERHNGTIFVHSTPGEGSIFSFSFPKRPLNIKN